MNTDTRVSCIATVTVRVFLFICPCCSHKLAAQRDEFQGRLYLLSNYSICFCPVTGSLSYSVPSLFTVLVAIDSACWLLRAQFCFISHEGKICNALRMNLSVLIQPLPELANNFSPKITGKQFSYYCQSGRTNPEL